MKMQYGNKRHAVAPVLATLLMIAVAVAMSVIIFMWSQGFLSNTSGSTGAQQGAQNQAAQSSIAIESATFSGTSATIVVRNVGAVGVTLGSVLVQGSSSNAGFTGSKIDSTPYTQTTTALCSATISGSGTSTAVVGKGVSCTLTETGLTSLASGDVVNFKITTNVGTFASTQATVS